MKPPSPYMTRAEAAEYLRCSMDTVDRMAVRQGWAVFKRQRSILLRRADVIRSVKLRTKPSADSEAAESAAMKD
jgi:excisionase family DNA binding protein